MSPSHEPSVSSQPSTSTSTQPSMSSRPSLSLSSRPSLSANPTISMSPSITVTETPTASMEPSHSPTCEALNTGGNYTIAGDGDGNGTVETVDMGYTYELMTSASASSASISSTVMMEEVIPALELAMVKFLIPGYFASICGDGGGTSGIRRMDESGSGTRLEDMDGMVGMSTSPVDVPLLSGECKRKLRYISTRYIYC